MWVHLVEQLNSTTTYLAMVNLIKCRQFKVKVNKVIPFKGIDNQIEHINLIEFRVVIKTKGIILLLILEFICTLFFIFIITNKL